MQNLLGVIFLILAFPAAAAQVAVQGARLWAAPDHTRVVFDLSAPLEHRVFQLKNPHRLVVDLRHSRLSGRLGALDFSRGAVKRLRSAPRDGGDLRVVLDLRYPIRPKTTVLPPNDSYGHRLVIDLEDAATTRPRTVKTARRALGDPLRDVIVAIDAGHGGDDPGAIGRHGTREKDVVLAIGRRLAKLINAEPGLRAVMIRDGDYYVGLRKRTELARRSKADLLISIHADAFRDGRARGASVYALSQRGATSEAARWLADRENAADLIGGVRLDDKDDLLASVLLDLSMTGTVEASLELGDHMLDELKRIGRVHKRRVGQAGFMVLKSPDIPSVLVETAFISNPREERNLRSAKHQQKLARSLLRGLQSYLSRNPPPGTLLAERYRRHIIARGDTLSEIAQRYSVSLRSLRSANGLKHDTLHVGDILRIPSASGS